MPSEQGCDVGTPRPGPPKFDRRFQKKLEAAGFSRISERVLGILVHYAWATLSLTSPVESVFFRLVTVEGYTVDRVAEALQVGEKTVRRGIQTAEDRLIAILELYREAEVARSNSALRIYDCFVSLMPEHEIQFPFHRRLLDILFHALAGNLDPVSGIAARLAWGTEDAQILPWPYKGEPAPPAGSLIPGLLKILVAPAEYVEVSRICRCMIALAHDKNLTKLWRTVLQVIQPGGGDGAQVEAEMVLFGVVSNTIGYAILTILARSDLCWSALCAKRFIVLAEQPCDSRVEVCYSRFLSE